jgi:hypothetical protein
MKDMICRLVLYPSMNRVQQPKSWSSVQFERLTGQRREDLWDNDERLYGEVGSVDFRLIQDQNSSLRGDGVFESKDKGNSAGYDINRRLRAW